MAFDELKEIFEQYDKAQSKHKTNYVSMEEAMKDDFMRKAMKKHVRKMKRQKILTIALILLIIAALMPIIIYYFYDKYLLFKQLPDVIPFVKENPLLTVLALLLVGGFTLLIHLFKNKNDKKK